MSSASRASASVAAAAGRPANLLTSFTGRSSSIAPAPSASASSSGSSAIRRFNASSQQPVIATRSFATDGIGNNTSGSGSTINSNLSSSDTGSRRRSIDRGNSSIPSPSSGSRGLSPGRAGNSGIPTSTSSSSSSSRRSASPAPSPSHRRSASPAPIPPSQSSSTTGSSSRSRSRDIVPSSPSTRTTSGSSSARPSSRPQSPAPNASRGSVSNNTSTNGIANTGMALPPRAPVSSSLLTTSGNASSSSTSRYDPLLNARAPSPRTAMAPAVTTRPLISLDSNSSNGTAPNTSGYASSSPYAAYSPMYSSSLSSEVTRSIAVPPSVSSSSPYNNYRPDPATYASQYSTPSSSYLMASPVSATATASSSSVPARYSSSYLAGSSSSSALTGSTMGSSTTMERSSTLPSPSTIPTSSYLASVPTASAAYDDYLGSRHRSSYITSSLDSEPTRSLSHAVASSSSTVSPSSTGEYKSDSSDDDSPDPILGSNERYYSSSSTRVGHTRGSGSGANTIIPSPSSSLYDNKSSTKSRSSNTTSGSGSNSNGRRIRGLVGLANLGNTCFMNSCLQCLLSAPPVIDYFANGRHQTSLNKKSRTKGQLAVAFGHLATAIRDGRDHSIEQPTTLKRLVALIAPQFAGYGQHDSQEFLRFLLMGLHDDTNRIVNQPPYVQIKDEDHDTDDVRSRRWWDNHSARNDSALMDAFCGQLKSKVVCLTCNNVSTAFDPFWDLSLPIPKSKSSSSSSSRTSSYSSYSSYSRYSSSYGGYGDEGSSSGSCSLADCFREFVRQETLTANEQVFCGRCKKHRDSSKQLSIYRFPPILVVHLKRFSYGSYSRSKLNTDVKFPNTLTLAEFAPKESKDDANPCYELFAVSNHSGGVGGGHYTAHASVVESDDGDWYTFNDSSVYACSKSSLGGSSAYVLFYRRKPSSSLPSSSL